MDQPENAHVGVRPEASDEHPADVFPSRREAEPTRGGSSHGSWFFRTRSSLRVASGRYQLLASEEQQSNYYRDPEQLLLV